MWVGRMFCSSFPLRWHYMYIDHKLYQHVVCIRMGWYFIKMVSNFTSPKGELKYRSSRRNIRFCTHETQWCEKKNFTATSIKALGDFICWKCTSNQNECPQTWWDIVGLEHGDQWHYKLRIRKAWSMTLGLGWAEGKFILPRCRI